MKNYKITVNGVTYDVTVEEGSGASSAPATAQPVPAAPSTPAPSAPAKAAGSVKVEAPMPGNILDVRVKPGMTVSVGDTLMILEAMKMENQIVAPGSGTVVSVNVNKGDTVEAGQLLATLD